MPDPAPYTADELAEVARRIHATELAAITRGLPRSVTTDRAIAYCMHDAALRARLGIASTQVDLAAGLLRLRDEVAS